MNENRETPPSRAAENPESTNPGAAIEETEATNTQVQDAVARATSSDELEAEVTVVEDTDTAAELAEAAAEAERLRREQIASVDTELNMEAVTAVEPSPVDSSRVAALDELPSAAATPFEEDPLARDGEIRISSDHPMAAFYVQTPMPPDIRGNRGAGTLIAVLATIGFALVYAGVLAATIAPSTPPSQFVDGMLEQLLSWGFIASAVAFLVGMIVLVLIFGRAGWWAYVLGGFFVGVVVWLAATVGGAVDADGVRALFDRSPFQTIEKFGLSITTIAAAIVARESAVWFGAWIGARGRKIKLKNAEALAEYDVALAESQSKSL
ncbi:hypothetical protein G7067_05975 [Leucobacter insecticola]|uniref:Uncharacterized protein n=1 Tax=Leucobacter insecticola TaxID=2714934 RepID=A0A6G8FHU5_9MICO|nr:hypothetical protein [Leucobacter insecticola]QIM16066.1 hypothetical protein G7067_05975 [Leucobacter insecticola]